MNPAGGELAVRGVPESYRPGETYRLELRLTGPALGRGGFQLSTRCAAGERAGEQAGVLRAPGGRAEVVEGTGEKYRGAEGVQYARHTKAGTRPDSGRAISWTLRWRAPERVVDHDDGGGGSCGRITLNAAGNVGNGDASEFGDRVYLEAVSVPPMEP